MSGSYSPAQRRTLAEAIERGETPPCPACGAALARHDIEAKPELAYVRRRALLICPGCRRSATVELPRGPGRPRRPGRP
jgi:uncharacterized protein with PIN domain